MKLGTFPTSAGSLLIIDAFAVGTFQRLDLSGAFLIVF
jgi:hypothetical protein